MSTTSKYEVSISCDIFEVTLGALSDFQPIKWVFPQTNICPLIECGLTCLNRKAAFVHFWAYHATTSVVCTVCNKLFLASNPLKIFLHYQLQHPNEKPPKLKLDVDKNDNQRVEHDEEKQEEHNDDDGGENSIKKRVTRLSKLIEKSEENGWISLEAHGYKTTWLFPDVVKCPVFRCNNISSDRSAAIAHYKEQHAANSILCSLCDKPIQCSTNLINFMKHYRSIHPKEKLPFNIDELVETSETSLHKKNPISISRQTVNNTDDNMITLSGCGIISQWRYPDDLKKCPVRNCGKRSKNQSYAIAHYRREHSMDAILCEICNKPICVRRERTFFDHYNYNHPDEQVPYDFQATSNRNSLVRNSDSHSTRVSFQLTNEEDKQNTSDSDDWITLTGFNRITKWKFPNVKCCPVKKCDESFESRSLAIQHYKKTHSMNYILCVLCQTPIHVNRTSLKNFRKHYESVHPNEPFQELDELKPESQEQPQEKKTCSQRKNVKRLTKEMKNLQIFICPLKDCNYSTEQMTEFREHWDDKHSYLDFPDTIQTDGNAGESSNLPDENSDRECENGSDENVHESDRNSTSSEQSSNESYRLRRQRVKRIRAKKMQITRRRTRKNICSDTESSDSSSISSDSNTSCSITQDLSEEDDDDQQNVRRATRSKATKRRLESSSDSSCSESSFSERRNSIAVVTRPKMPKKYSESTDEDEDEDKFDSKEIESQDIPLRTVDPPEISNDLQISLVQENVHEDEHEHPIVNAVDNDDSIYVPDSDEEMMANNNFVKREHDISSKFDESHIRMLGVIMIPKSQI